MGNCDTGFRIGCMSGGVKVKKVDDETMAILREKVEKGELSPDLWYAGCSGSDVRV